MKKAIVQAKRSIGVWNEWGRPREAAIGRACDQAEPGWLSDEGNEELRHWAGDSTRISRELQRCERPFRYL